jgi:hypothetical protein
MKTFFKFIRFYLIVAVLYCITVTLCSGQITPKTELQLECEYYRIRYQHNNNAWTKWDTIHKPIMLAIFPEQQTLVIDDGNTDFNSQQGLNSIYSIRTRDNINSKWYSGTDANGRPLTVKIIRNEDLTYNVELRYENYFDRTRNRILVAGKATEYLNCKITTL